MNNKKAQVVSFGNAPSIIISLVVLVLCAGAGIIGLAAMKSGQTPSYNPTVSNVSLVNTSLDYGITGTGNFTAQIPTIGTMLGIGLVILVILGVFAYGIMRKGGGSL